MLWPSRLFRYLSKEVLGPTLLGLALWTFVLLMNHFFFVAERALAKNLGFDLTAKLFVVGLPAILILAIPMAVLLGSLVAMGRFSADHEWDAMQSAGHSPWRVLRPLLTHGLAASLVGFVIYSEVAPRANYVRRDLQGEVLFSSSLAADLKPRVFYSELENAVLFVHDIRPGDNGRLEGVLLVRHYPRKASYDVILARRGDLFPAADRSGTLFLDLYDGVLHNFDPEKPDAYVLTSFQHIREPFYAPEYMRGLLAPPQKVVSDMRLTELIGEFRLARTERAAARARLGPRASTPEGGQDLFLVNHRVRVATVEFHSRFALPFASLLLASLALPLGLRRARSGKGAGFAVSLLVILVYWTTYTFARDQALAGKIPAALGPWLADAVIALWAVVGFARIGRPREPERSLLARAVRLVRSVPRRLVPRRSPAEGAATSPAPDGMATLQSLGGTSARFVLRVDQYVAATYVRMLGLALASAYLVYGLVELKKLTDGLLRTRQSASLLLEYFPYFAASVLHIVLPISCLIAAVVAFTLLSRGGELTAIQASGQSLRRATVPALVVTGLLCGLLFIVQDSIGPVAARRAREIEDKIFGRGPRTYGIPPGGRWGFGPEGRRLYHFRSQDADARQFEAFTVLTLDRETPRILDHRYARRARWLGGSTWELEGGWYRSFPHGDAPGSYRRFEGVRNETLEAPAELGSRQLLATLPLDVTEQLSLGEMRREIAELHDSGYDTTRLRVAMQGKIARAAAPFVMVLLGLPFAFRVGRRGALYGIGVALVLVIAYWAVFAVFNALGLETVLQPWVAAWTPNVVFGLLGAYLMLFVRT